MKKVYDSYCHLLYATFVTIYYTTLSYDVAPGSEIAPCNKFDKPPVVYMVYRFTGNVMMSITRLRT